MKSIFRTVAALAAVVLAGCTNEFNEVDFVPADGKTSVTIGLNDTRTSLGELNEGVRKVYWSKGDQIAINGVTSAEAKIAEDNAGLATFDFEGVLEYPYSVLYPAEMYKDNATITLPASQKYTAGSFAVDAAPMAGNVAAAGEAISLHHLAAVVRLQVKAAEGGDAHDINRIEFRGNAGEQVSGDFAIDYQTATLTSASVAEADKVVKATYGKSLGGDVVDFFVVVPAREYAQGFTVRVLDDAGHYMDLSTAAITLAEGEIKAMPEFEFKPTGTSIDVEIKSAADLVAFAKAYNAREFEGRDPFVVNVTADIIFDDDTNAEFVSIGCKDDEGDNYFSGYFDGGKHTIKNWKSSRPLFLYTATSSTVCDLTIDASCTFTANNTDENPYVGPFVGWHKGMLKNCHNNTNVVATGSSWTGDSNNRTCVGGLVGYTNNGSIVECSVSGDITMGTDFITASKYAYLGGLSGTVAEEGSISDSYMYGSMTHRGGSTYDEGNTYDGRVYFGGIAGRLDGTCTNCHVFNETANAKTLFFGNYVYDGASTDVHANHYRYLYVGGIVGNATETSSLSNCTNYAQMTVHQFSGGADGTSGGSKDFSRYLNVGGIVGETSGIVSDCTMYGDIANRSSCLQQAVGGVLGVVNATSTIDNCAMEGSSITHGTSGNSYYQARNARFGGVIGYSKSLKLSKLSNKANVGCSRLNNNTSTTLRLGGIIGFSEVEGEIDGANQIVNTGEISSNYTAVLKSISVGGIVGEGSTSWKNVKNEGKVGYTINADGIICKDIFVGGILGFAVGDLTITSAANTGISYCDISKSVAELHYNICVGGILGTNNDSKVVNVVSSTNSGSVAIQNGGTKTNGRSVALGGIVGALTNGASSISRCTNTGCVSNQSSNNTVNSFKIRETGGSVHIGGIAGYVEGADGDLLSVSDCVFERFEGCSDNYGNKSYGLYAIRGSVATIVGSAKYADIKNCNGSTYLYLTNSTSLAGLVCAMTNSNLENCKVYNTTLWSKGTSPYNAGIVAYATASTIKNNIMDNVNLTGTATVTAVLAGQADDASSFIDNKVSGKILDADITLSSTMIGSGNPTVSGTALYTK